MTERVVKAGYLLGVALTLASIIYFFAANWQGFDRLTKVSLSVGLMVLFYGSSAIVMYVMKRHDFLSKWLFVAGVIAFGISVALIGQVYNSHADSVWLFLIWLTPSAAFAWLTRYDPLRLLSVVLLQLTFWFYYFPSSYNTQREEWEAFIILLIFAFVNAVIWIISRSSVVSYVAYIVMHGWLFVIFATGITYEQFVAWPYVYALFFVGFFYYLKKRPYILITGLFAGAFLIVQYFRVVDRYFQGGVFIAGLLLAAVIVYAGIYLLRRTIRSADGAKGIAFTIAFQAIVTVIASSIAVSSIMGMIAIWTSDFSPYGLLALSIGGFVAPALFWNKWNHVVRYTLLAIGYILGAISSWGVAIALFTGYSVLLLLVSLKLSPGVRTVTNVALSVYGAIIVFHWTNEFRMAILFVFLFNSALYRFVKRSYECFVSLMLGFGALLALTILHLFAVDVWYVLFNVLFVILVISVIFSQTNEHERLVAWTYWWLFLLLKYYEFAWDLLHKSLSLLIVGVLLLAGTVVVEKRKGLLVTELINGLKQKWLLLLSIVVIQIAFIGYVAFDKEQRLKHGEVVKLELVPADPRSLLQGDYVRLGYEISTMENLNEQGRIQVICAKTKREYIVSQEFMRLMEKGTIRSRTK